MSDAIRLNQRLSLRTVNGIDASRALNAVILDKVSELLELLEGKRLLTQGKVNALRRGLERINDQARDQKSELTRVRITVEANPKDVAAHNKAINEALKED